jgi:hypothetical protein
MRLRPQEMNGQQLRHGLILSSAQSITDGITDLRIMLEVPHITAAQGVGR